MAKKSKVSPSTSQPAPVPRQVGTAWRWDGFRMQAILLGFIAIIFYGNTYNNEYAFDDNIVIINNEYVLEGFAGLHDILTKDGYESYYRQFNTGNQLSGGRYRPLSLVTFAIEQQFFGAIDKDKVDSVMHSNMNETLTGPYREKVMRDMHLRHLLNVLWFAVAIVALLCFLRLVFRDDPVMAFVAALLFTIHPIHTEVVANVKSRDEILSLLFICLTFLFALRHQRDGKVRSLLVAVSCFFLALLSKEYGITLLVLLPLAFYIFDGATLRKSLLATLPFAGAATVYLLARLAIAQPVAESAANLSVLNHPYALATGTQKIATELSTSLRYLRLLLYPHPLSFDYSYNQIPYQDFSSPWVWVAILFYGFLVWAFIYFFRRRHVLSFAIAFYGLNLLLICNLLFDIGATMGERLVYHASLGFAMVAAYALVKGARRLADRSRNLALASLLAVLTVLCGAKTITRNRDWRNNNTLSFHDLATSPNSILVNSNVAIALMNGSDQEKDTVQKRKDLQRSVQLLTKVISIYDGYDKAFINRSLAYFRMGMLDSVWHDAGSARAINPVHPQLPDIYFNLGIAFANNKEYDKADSAWAVTVALMPDYPNARHTLDDLRRQRIEFMKNNVGM